MITKILTVMNLIIFKIQSIVGSVGKTNVCPPLIKNIVGWLQHIYAGGQKSCVSMHARLSVQGKNQADKIYKSIVVLVSTTTDSSLTAFALNDGKIFQIASQPLPQCRILICKAPTSLTADLSPNFRGGRRCLILFLQNQYIFGWGQQILRNQSTVVLSQSRIRICMTNIYHNKMG